MMRHQNPRPANDTAHLKTLLQWLWRHAWVTLPLLALPAMWPLLSRGLTGSADGEIHLFRLMALDQQVHQGILFPRWVPDLYTGLGYPLFNYYAPLSYYPGVVLHALGFSYGVSLALSFCLLILAGGLGMYRFAVDVFGERFRGAALVAAVAYMLTPYLLTNVYVRGAVAEVAAQALLPWVFWSVRRLLTSREPIDYLVPVVLALGALALTHNITLILLPPAILGYALVLWWQEGKSRSRLGWTVLAFGMAAGASAFFWLPVAAERAYTLQEPFTIAANTFVPENVWRWKNFLDKTVLFKYTFSIPFQLGLVQLALAVVGLVVARRKDPEWVFLIVLTIAACLFIGAWSVPIWLSNDLLLTVQFPWRLLSIVSVPMALFIGGVASRCRPAGRQMALSAGLIAVVIVANSPRTGWMSQLDAPTGPAPAAIARFEFEKKAPGTTYMQEFQPRWALPSTASPAQAGSEASDAEPAITIERANRTSIRATVESPSGGPLRFGTFYFPGWQITADGKRIQPYPSTQLGLLTADVPPNTQRLRVEWRGTGVQAAGAAISLLTLLGLCVLVGWRARRRWLAAFPAIVLALGVFATLWRPVVAEVQAPQTALQTEELSLLGYQLRRLDARNLVIYPYWFVRRQPSSATRVAWQLRDDTGSLVAETIARSYYNSFSFDKWPSGTVVDDAVLLSLPAGLPASAYELSVQILSDTDSADALATQVATIDLETPRAEQTAHDRPAFSTDAQFGGMALVGYDVLINGTPVAEGDRPVAKPGDFVTYELSWQAAEPIEQNYQAFVHLVNSQGKLQVQEDHLAGSAFTPPPYWSSLGTQRDRYVMQIPWDAPNAVLWPIVGVYDANSLEQLSVNAPEGATHGDSYRLSAVKVLANPSAPEPEATVDARFGDSIRLLGYDLDLPQPVIQPGASFTVTLHFQGQTPISQDLVRFVHLYNADLGLAAQTDSRPSSGTNPTWAWVPGEIVLDKAVLTVPDTAPPGEYSLLVGLYDPTTAARLPVRDAAGAAQPNDALQLTPLGVEP